MIISTIAVCLIVTVSPVTAKVKIKDASGNPIVGMDLETNFGTMQGGVRATTDGDGVATFEINPPSNLKGFEVRPRESQPANIDRAALGIPLAWAIAIPPNQSIISAEFVCPGSSPITLRAIEGTTPIAEYNISADTFDHTTCWVVASQGEHATFSGLPKGKSSEVYVTVPRKEQNADGRGFKGVFQIVTTQTPVLTGPTDLGDISVPAFVPDSTLDITITGSSMPVDAPPFFRFGPGFSLVSEDGHTIYGISVYVVAGDPDEGHAHRTYSIPHGTYYVVPGAGVEAHFTRVVARIRAGETLTNSGIPRVTLTAGATSTISFDQGAVEAAIHSPPN